MREHIDDILAGAAILMGLMCLSILIVAFYTVRAIL
jgi:hypothetical protein